MKKSHILMTVAALATAAALTGCVHCAEPNLTAEGKILDECAELNHKVSTDVDPNSLAIVRPGLLPGKEFFRPQFQSGARRVQATGVAKTVKEARINAIKNFLAENECDFIVAVNFRDETVRHPQAAFWRLFFRGDVNCKTTLSGIPIALVGLAKEEILPPPPPEPKAEPAPAPAEPAKCNCDIEKKLDVIIEKMSEETPAPVMHRPGLMKFKDIDISVHAKGETPDDTGIVFPALPCEKIVCAEAPKPAKKRGFFKCLKGCIGLGE